MRGVPDPAFEILRDFLKIEFVDTGGGFYSYYNHLNLDKEREICKKEESFMGTTGVNIFF